MPQVQVAEVAVSAKTIAHKVREDPLFGMKKREQENVRAIMDNPFKVQALRQARQCTAARHTLMGVADARGR